MSTGLSLVKPVAFRTHFSWVYFVFSIIWGLCSYAVFSDYTIHWLNDTEEIATSNPWTSPDWVTKGESASFSPCGDSLCIDSHSDGRSSMMRFFDIDKEKFNAADYLLVSLAVNAPAQLPGSRNPSPSTPIAGRKASLVVVSALNTDGRLMKFALPPVYLDNIGSRTHFRKISEVHSRTHTLRLALIMRSKGQWTINSLSVHMATLNLPYKMLRWLIFAGWVASLLWLVPRLLSGIHPATKVVCAVVVCLAVPAAVGGAGPAIFSNLASFFISFRTDVELGETNLKTSWQPALHFIVHLLMTLYFYIKRVDLNMNTLGIVLLNLALAIGVECTQMGVPGRSSDLEDIALAMAGMMAGILLFQSVSYAARRLRA